MKRHHLLGTLSSDIVDRLKTTILGLRDPYNFNKFQRIEFDEPLIDYLKTIIVSDLEVQKNMDRTRWIQKAFYSSADYVYPIHRDGLKCRSALNIIVDCNSDDWTRWFNQDVVNEQTKNLITIEKPNGISSRETDLPRDIIESLDYEEQFRGKPGDVYLIDVDSFHTWKCSGPNNRIVIQTKFQGFPTFDNLVDRFVSNTTETNFINGLL
jgi:hypothetical protein